LAPWSGAHHPSEPFKWRHYPGEVILHCVRWYLRYPISYLHMAEMMLERGLEIDPSCIWRWVQQYAPELEKRCRPHLKPTNKSYRVDETYIKVKGKDRYLYRAVDSTGQTIDFLLTAKRDAAAAKRFFRKAGRPEQPSAASHQCGQEPGLRPCGHRVEVRKDTSPALSFTSVCKYLNNIVEQDHRTAKKRVWLAKGYGSFHSAWRTIRGVEAVHLIRKGRVRRVAKNDSLAQARFISTLFGVAI
jgi:transposase, IS6 family